MPTLPPTPMTAIHFTSFATSILGKSSDDDDTAAVAYAVDWKSWQRAGSLIEGSFSADFLYVVRNAICKPSTSLMLVTKRGKKCDGCGS